VLICVADEMDPAIDIVHRIKQRYPNVDCRLFTGGRDGILNPLVHNLTPAYELAKYDIMWISTSRIKGYFCYIVATCIYAFVLGLENSHLHSTCN
jgi:ceramide glucosyltransferase